MLDQLLVAVDGFDITRNAVVLVGVLRTRSGEEEDEGVYQGSIR